MAHRPYKHRRRDSDAYVEFTIFSSEVANERAPPVLSIDTASSDLRRVYRDSLLLDPNTGSGYSSPSTENLQPPLGVDIGDVTDWDPLLNVRPGEDAAAEREIFEEGEMTIPAVRYSSSVSLTKPTFCCI